MGYLKTNADIIYTGYAYIRTNENLGANALYWAGHYLKVSDAVTAGAYLQNAAAYFDLSSIKMTSMGLYHKANWYWVENSWAGVDVVNMSTILNAMWDAEPYQCLLFVPMIDAMRGAISEKTVLTSWMSEAMKRFT